MGRKSRKYASIRGERLSRAIVSQSSFGLGSQQDSAALKSGGHAPNLKFTRFGLRPQANTVTLYLLTFDLPRDQGDSRSGTPDVFRL
jgi:hypothetical protein